MNFHLYELGWKPTDRLGSEDDLDRANQFWRHASPLGPFLAAAEMDWIRNVRPYYKLWPAFADALMKLRIDVRLCDIRLPDPLCVSVRFAKTREPISGPYRLRSFLMVHYKHRFIIISNTEHKDQLVISYFSIDMTKESTLEEYCNDSYPSDTDCPTSKDTVDQFTKLVIRFAVGVGMLADDPEFMERDVLAKHRLQYDQTKDEKYVEKAKKRGINGWNLGKTFETCPHYRRPHLALRHTGTGRTVPKIVPVRGTVVHRKKMTDVPTGYTLPNGKDIEPSA